MKNSLISRVVFYVVLSIAAIIVIIPFLWMVSTSFDRLLSAEMPSPPRFYPLNVSFFNYEIVTTNMPIFTYIMNTIIIALMSVGLNLFVVTLAGFALSKGKFFGKPLILLLILSNMMIPFEIKLMPVYQMIKGLNLSNTYLGVVLPAVMTNAYFIYFVKQFCDDLPDALLEAATIDGANKFTIYSRIFLPLLGPIMATIAVLDVLNVWNDLLWPMIVINNDKLNTIQLGMVFSSMQTQAGVACAMSVLSILPLALVFIFLQRYIVQSVAATGLRQ